MRVAEDEPRGGDAGQEFVLVRRRLRQERADVGDRGAVADQRVAADEGGGEGGELRDDALAERSAGGRERGLHVGIVRRLVRRGRPALAVAADPQRRKLAQARDGLRRPAAEERVVAAEDEGLRVVRVGEHRFERGQVAVHVVEQCLHRPCIASGR